VLRRDKVRIPGSPAYGDASVARQSGYEPFGAGPAGALFDGIRAEVSFEEELISPFALIAVTT